MQRPASLLQPIPVLERLWQAMTIDLIIDLLRTSDGYDIITVIIDQLIKMAHFVVIEKTYDTLAIAKVFVQYFFQLHRIPEVIIMDRDSRFTSCFWKALLEILGMKLSFSTAFYLQTDGQIERVN